MDPVNTDTPLYEPNLWGTDMSLQHFAPLTWKIIRSTDYETPCLGTKCMPFRVVILDTSLRNKVHRGKTFQKCN